jgi:hypothetical protein
MPRVKDPFVKAFSQSSFRGDDELSEVGTPRQEPAPQEKGEWLKCANGFEGFLYFCRAYLRVRHIDSPTLVPFDMYDCQIEMMQKIFAYQNVCVSISRQSGKTICICALLCWHLVFSRQMPMLTAAHLLERARDTISLVQLFFRQVPTWMKSNVAKWNSSGIWLESGSSLVAKTCKATRGGTFALIHSDEYAHIPTIREANEFNQAIFPALSSGSSSRFIATSTHKGLGGWYELTESIRKGGLGANWCLFEVDWKRIPRGRPPKDPLVFAQEYLAAHGIHDLRQEIYTEPLSTGTTLIDAGFLKEMQTQVNKDCVTEENGAFRYWQAPVKRTRERQQRGVYFCAMDSASGHGRDFTVISIFRCDCRPFLHVGTYRSNWIDPLKLPGIIMRVGSFFNKANVFAETNNDPQISDNLLRIGYPNIVYSMKDLTSGQMVAVFEAVPGCALGLRMTAPIKEMATVQLKSLIERKELITQDEVAIDEFTRYSWMPNKSSDGGKWGAIKGHDDVISTFLLFALAVNSPNFEQNIKRRVLGSDYYNADEEPFVLRSDGLSMTSHNPHPRRIEGRQEIVWLLGADILEARARRARDDEYETANRDYEDDDDGYQFPQSLRPAFAPMIGR